MKTLVSIVSDTHFGSTVAICPPGPIKIDDGHTFYPSEHQQWIWNHWCNFWDRVAEEVKGVSRYIMVTNGDLVEGDHHNTPQLFSRNLGVEREIVDMAFEYPLSLEPDNIVVVRGTEAHVGRSAAKEESIAKSWHKAGLPVQAAEDTGTYSHWQFRAEIHGKLLDFTHHGRTGHRPWTDQNAVNLLAWQIFTEHARDGHRPPDLAIRSHFHRHFDSYDAAPTRAIQTPCWQLHTGHTRKVVPESVAHVGGIMLILEDGVAVEKIAMILKPERSPVWSP
jgi:hypothetical protein